ncbi:hypothetical protein AAFF_G00195710 [Aldrovandia affinis]|uniref:Glutaminyl-peptide cyclotransferase n=1 Tax=Aldrovandia affinis TaxID=143900 RepID=A0AAD7RLK9_9TELE|nr:hypothetical protein AAFF_G00195710 [Aldrovandia affinis]
MSKSSRRYKSAPANSCSALPVCGQVRMPRPRMLLCCLCGVLTVTLLLGIYLSNDTGDINSRVHTAGMTREKLSHKPSKSSTAQVQRLVSQVDRMRLWETHLRPILIQRLPGTPGSQAVRQHISTQLSALSAPWSVEIDSFPSPTPRGLVTFSNVLAVLDPQAPRRLLLACHYDSKALPPAPESPQQVFLGVSDSAIPCAMILELVTALDVQLKALAQQKSPVTLQLVFFDGEEAFEEWTATDSLYGSRHLAEHMSRTPHPPGSSQNTLLQAVDLFVLLDLIGAADPLFVNHFDNTARWFDRLIVAEKRLHKLGLLSSHPSEQSYFRKDIYLGPVQDDHIPFLQRGVPVLHFIATPFPYFWHTMEDTEQNMHPPTVENLTKILAVFLAEYLGF